MSVRDQERREKQAMLRADRVEQRIRTKQRRADKRADQVARRIDKGDVQPRRLPGKNEPSASDEAT